MTKAMQTVYEAFIAAIQDGAMDEARILETELEQMANEAQVICPLTNWVVG